MKPIPIHAKQNPLEKNGCAGLRTLPSQQDPGSLELLAAVPDEIMSVCANIHLGLMTRIAFLLGTPMDVTKDVDDSRCMTLLGALIECLLSPPEVCLQVDIDKAETCVSDLRYILRSKVLED